MGTEIVRRLRSDIPEEHKVTDDARLEWLWNQRLAQVAAIYLRTTDIRDRMNANLVLNAAMSSNLASIELLFRRLEGGAVADQVVLEGESLPI